MTACGCSLPYYNPRACENCSSNDWSNKPWTVSPWREDWTFQPTVSPWVEITYQPDKKEDRIKELLKELLELIKD